jgi:SEC-C motif
MTQTVPKLVLPNVSTEIRDKFFKNNTEVNSVDVPPGGIMYQYEGHKGGISSHLSVLGIAGDTAACGQYRVKYPLMVLASQGAKVCARVVIPEAPLSADDILDMNVIFLQRQADPELMRLAKTVQQITGAIIVYDLDDYLHGVSPKSPAYRAYNPETPGGKKILSGISQFISESDGCIFSTRELQALYRKDSKYSHVLMNGVDVSLDDRDWDLSKPRFDWRTLAEEQGCKVDSDSLLFGISAGSTHQEDFLLLGDSVKEILSKTKDSFFAFQSHPQIAMNLCVNQWQLPLNRVVILPATQFAEYPRGLSAFDVNLAPLTASPFNFGKSCLRLIEFGAWGVPYVASRVAPFYRFHKESEGKGGYMVDRGQSFTNSVVKLLTDHDDRKEKSEFIRDYVRTEYDIRKTMSTLGYTLDAIRANRDGKVSLPSRLDISDSIKGIPTMRIPVGAKDPCPCGSGKIYKRCLCEPAFGRI